MNVGQPFFAVVDTDPSGPDSMPDLESHSGPRLDCQNLFIEWTPRWSTTSSR